MNDKEINLKERDFNLKDFEFDLGELFIKYNLDNISNYFNGEVGYWIFDKKRTTEVHIGIKPMPDKDDIENFEENLNEWQTIWNIFRRFKFFIWE